MPRQPFPILIIDIDDRGVGNSRTGAVKQPPLRREVVVEILVIIHVFAREVRENRRGEMTSPQSIQR